MRNLILIEDFSTKYSIPKGDIITLNVKSHYELLKRGIEHYTISEFVDFESKEGKRVLEELKRSLETHS